MQCRLPWVRIQNSQGKISFSKSEKIQEKMKKTEKTFLPVYLGKKTTRPNY